MSALSSTKYPLGRGKGCDYLTTLPIPTRFL